MIKRALLFTVLASLPIRPATAAPVVDTPRASAAARAGEVVDERTPVPVPEPSPLAVRYHRTGMYLWAFARCWELAVPVALLVSGASARMRGLAARVGRVWFLTVGVYVVLFVLVVFLAELPLRYYAGFVRQHAYGLSRQTIGKWSGDAIKALGLELLGGFCFAWVPFFVIRRAPRTWWLIVSALIVPFVAFLTLIHPIWIDPIFNDYGPMTDPALERKVLDLAERAGVSGGRVFEVNKSVDTKAANAFVTGLFGTKRIVFWDTLLHDFDEHEVLAVTGHEIGHYVLNHIPWSIALSSFLIVAGLFWVDFAGRRLVARFSKRFGFDSLADVAATPLILALLAISSPALAPLALAYSRHNEHEADRFALELTHFNRSAARAFADLQRENLGVPRPSFFERVWRSSHPDVAERIEFCNSYRPWEVGVGGNSTAVRLKGPATP